MFISSEMRRDFS